MNLSIIITTFNSEKYIKNCLRSIINSLEGQNYEIIISDNDSKDHTLDVVDAFQLKHHKVIKNNSNLGYSNSINKAIESSAFNTLLILNPDVILKKNTILELYKIVEKKDIGVVGPKLINRDGSFQLSSRRHFPTLGVLLSYLLKLNKIFPKSRFFGKYNYTFEDQDTMLEVDSVSGACMIFEKKNYKLAGGFDEGFFMYFEDSDFCFKIKNKGLKIIYCPMAEAVHYNDYSDNYYSKMNYFFESFVKFIYKYKKKICLGWFIYFTVSLIRHLSYLKRIIYFNYNYKKNNE